MNKILIIIGLIIIYIVTIFIVGVSVTSDDELCIKHIDSIELVNSLEDMQEWMEQDIYNEEVSESIGNTYIENMEYCIQIITSNTKQNE